MVSVIVALLCFTAFYRVFSGPSSVQMIPKISTPIHQQFIPEQPVMVRNPFNESQWIRIDPLEQGEIYGKQHALKRYFWRNIIIRPCDGTCYSPHKK